LKHFFVCVSFVHFNVGLHSQLERAALAEHDAARRAALAARDEADGAAEAARVRLVAAEESARASDQMVNVDIFGV
jgi:hypothetical protein